MRFVHIADTHLGFAAFSRVDEDGMNLRERLVYENFLAATETIIREKPDALIHAGDLFDRVRPKTRAYTTVLQALDRLKEADIPLVVVSGNHSMPKTRYTTSPFEVLTYHTAAVHAAFRYRYEHVEVGDTIFHLIPNLLNPSDYRDAFDGIQWSSDHANVLVTHGLASILTDRRLRTVAEHELDSTVLSPEFDYIALGHFHDQRQIADNAWYSGSLEYVTYGEIHDTKGGLLVDAGTHSVSCLPLPHTPMIDLGRISCPDESPEELASAIVQAVRQVPADMRHPMCQITLDGITRETLRALGRKDIADAKRQVLDLRLRVISGDSPVPVSDRDLHAVDYVGEFETFLKKNPPAPKEFDFILTTGQEALRTAITRHTEDQDAAP
jgi:exonuclease SbcD